MKKRTGDPWMPADEYGRSLKGVGINLLVASIEAARSFHTEVLGAEEVYWDTDFAVYRGYRPDWPLHADHTHQDHELFGIRTSYSIICLCVELPDSIRYRGQRTAAKRPET